MAGAVGITLAATGVAFGNEFVQGNINPRLLVAGFGSALFLDGVQYVNPTLGKGLATILFVSVMLTPYKGKAPLASLAALVDVSSNQVATNPVLDSHSVNPLGVAKDVTHH